METVKDGRAVHGCWKVGVGPTTDSGRRLALHVGGWTRHAGGDDLPLILGQLLLVPQHLIIGTTNNRGFCVVGHGTARQTKRKMHALYHERNHKFPNQNEMDISSQKKKKVKINQFYSLNKKSQIIIIRKNSKKKFQVCRNAFLPFFWRSQFPFTYVYVYNTLLMALRTVSGMWSWTMTGEMSTSLKSIVSAHKAW